MDSLWWHCTPNKIKVKKRSWSLNWYPRPDSNWCRRIQSPAWLTATLRGFLCHKYWEGCVLNRWGDSNKNIRLSFAGYLKTGRYADAGNRSYPHHFKDPKIFRSWPLHTFHKQFAVHTASFGGNCTLHKVRLHIRQSLIRHLYSQIFRKNSGSSPGSENYNRAMQKSHVIAEFLQKKVWS